jgi:hypothetical protein
MPAKLSKYRKHPEQDLQKAVVQFLACAVPPPPVGPFWFAPDPGVQAGGQHAARIGGIRKAMGVRPGVADLVFLRPNPFCIELKAGRNSLDAPQRIVMAELNDLGIHTHVVRSIDQLVVVLQAENVPMRAEVLA